MADEFITAETLASYPGVPAGVDLTLAVEMANGLVYDIIGDLTPIPWKAKAIAFEIAARGLRNASGASSESKKIDDWTHTIRFEGEQFKAGFYLTDDEEADLLALLGEDQRAVGSIRLHVPGYGRGRAYGC